MIRTVLVHVVILLVLAGTAGMHARASEYPRNYWKVGYPDYCQYSFDGNRGHPQKSPYATVYGWKNFQHLHHYCRGLYRMKEAAAAAESTAAMDSSFYRATMEFNYVLDNTGPDFVLKPEILVQKGISLLAIGKFIEAIECFNEALELRRDYVPAYVALANYFLNQDDPEGAREVLEIGLAHAPDSEILLGMLADIDGA